MLFHQLTDWLQGKYHKVIFDIFFSSVPLLKEQKRKNILAYGTIQPNRKDLPVIADEKLCNSNAKKIATAWCNLI